ncbi:hypothetical protein BDQ17DRAFT_546213 [Cyathus striatus]|nr:hypothetical protein BDQ17DRAFT_546213 [Cyathus striatus]
MTTTTPIPLPKWASSHRNVSNGIVHVSPMRANAFNHVLHPPPPPPDINDYVRHVVCVPLPRASTTVQPPLTCPSRPSTTGLLPSCSCYHPHPSTKSIPPSLSRTFFRISDVMSSSKLDETRITTWISITLETTSRTHRIFLRYIIQI